jgi:hypothetical protein
MIILTAFAITAIQQFPLTTTQGLTPLRVDVRAVMYNGRHAVRLTHATSDSLPFGALALVNGSEFHDGTIQLHLAAMRSVDADSGSRGFAGIVFRTSRDGGRFENFYVRATNGRADDQLRRNHTLQYQADPVARWDVLRHDSPQRYESYADLVAGEWTSLRVVVHGAHAALYVNGAHEPSLLVNDLKLGDTRGLVGLWIGPGTVGYFSNLQVIRAADPN